MKDLIKAIDGLPKIVRFLGTLIWGILANIYRLCRSIAKQDVLGVVLAIDSLFFGLLTLFASYLINQFGGLIKKKPSGFFYLFNCGKIGTYKLVIR